MNWTWRKRRNVLECEMYHIVKKDGVYKLYLFSLFDDDSPIEEGMDIERLKNKAKAHYKVQKDKKKCRYCKKDQGEHKAEGLFCPNLWSKGRAGYTSYSKEQKFKPIYEEKDK